VGDGGFAMLMAELATAVPVKVPILNNGCLAEVAFEQREAGFGVFGCELSPLDFVAYPKACGVDGGGIYGLFESENPYPGDGTATKS
jgi:pyruvate dehydrogenase (quinone)